MVRSILVAALLALALPVHATDAPSIYASAPAGEHWAVIKADDMTGDHMAQWLHFLDIAHQRNVPVSIGIITNSLQKRPADYAAWLRTLLSPQLQFWSHGWDHASWQVNGQQLFEFSGSGLPHQQDDFNLAQKISAADGVPLTVFGAPNNKMDADTATVLNAHPEVSAVFCYRGDTACTSLLKGKVLIPMDIRGEADGTGKPNFAKFQNDYAKWTNVTATAIQFHPPYFTDAGFTELDNIIQFLQQKGWKFVLPSDFVARPGL